MAWLDDIEITVSISTAGDFVSLGTRTDYPFETGGSGGLPSGWTMYNSAGRPGSDVNFTTQLGRFSISNAVGAASKGFYYGAYRDFPVTAGKQYIWNVQSRQMDGKEQCHKNARYEWVPSGSGLSTHSVVANDWEQISQSAGVAPSGQSLRVILQGVQWGDFDGENWGLQYQNVALTELNTTYPEPTWKPVTCSIHSMNCRYGRDRFNERYDVGSMTLAVINDDGTFRYQPGGWLRPGRFVKVEVTEKAFFGVYPLFYGIIDSLTDSYSLDGHAVTNISAVDISSLLSNRTTPTASSQSSNFRTGDRIKRILDAVGWHPTMRNIQTGIFVQQPVTANGRTVRDEMALGADSEGGHFYGNRDGRITFIDRDAKYVEQATEVQAELLAMPWNGTDPLPVIDAIPDKANYLPIIPARELQTSWSRDRVVNEVQLANQGGSAFVVVDAESQKKFGPRTYQRLDFLNVNDVAYANQLQLRFQDIMDGYTDAIIRVNSVAFKPFFGTGQHDRDVYWFTYRAWFPWIVRVRYQHPTEGWGFGVVSHIQGVTHQLTSKEWTTVLTLDQPEAFNYWETPAEPIGWDISVWDEGRWDDNAGEGAYWNRGFAWSPAADYAVAKWGF